MFKFNRDSNLQITTWDEYAEWLISQPYVIEYMKPLYARLTNIVCTPDIAFLHYRRGEKFSVLITEHTYNSQHSPFIQSAEYLIFLTHIQRLNYFRSFPKDFSMPNTMVLPRLPTNLVESKNEGESVGILIPDAVSNYYLYPILIGLNNESKFLNNTQIYVLTYSADQQLALTDAEHEENKVKVLNLQNLPSDFLMPSLLLTVDKMSASPVAQSSRYEGFKVGYIGDHFVRRLLYPSYDSEIAKFLQERIEELSESNLDSNIIQAMTGYDIV